jgi:hypothetical protein
MPTFIHPSPFVEARLIFSQRCLAEREEHQRGAELRGENRNRACLTASQYATEPRLTQSEPRHTPLLSFHGTSLIIKSSTCHRPVVLHVYKSGTEGRHWLARTIKHPHLLLLFRDRDQEARMVEDVFWDPHLVLTPGEEENEDGKTCIAGLQQVEILGPEDPVRLLRPEGSGRTGVSQEAVGRGGGNQEAGGRGGGNPEATGRGGGNQEAVGRGGGNQEAVVRGAMSQDATTKKAMEATWNGDASETSEEKTHQGFTPYPPEIKASGKLCKI